MFSVGDVYRDARLLACVVDAKWMTDRLTTMIACEDQKERWARAYTAQTSLSAYVARAPVQQQKHRKNTGNRKSDI